VRSITSRFCLVVLLGVVWSGDARGSAPPQVSGPPRTQGTPPRDAAKTETKGTAVIRGRVVAADTGRPLRRTRVTVSAPALGDEGRRTTSTDLDGRYEIKELRAARYRVSVTRGGFLPLEYGQRRPGELGRPIQIADGQTVEKIDFALPRMSVITGRVTDETGEPIEGVSIYAMRMLFFEGSRRFVPASSSSDRTDDSGEYRISRLPPGSYAVMASTRETWRVMENGKETVLGYMPTYFPGVAAPGEARRVNLAVGQETRGIDFSLVPGRTAKISGIALDSQRRPFTRVSLGIDVRGLGFGSFSAGPDVTVAPDGTFTANNVPPGEYTLSASRMADDPHGEPEVAITRLVVEGTDIEGITLSGSAGGTVSGRFVVEGETVPKMSAIRVQIAEALRIQPSPVLLGAFRNNGGSSPVKDDGTFSVEHVFGRARFRVSVPEGWMLKAVMHNGRDLADDPIELQSGETLNGVEVIVTNRVTSIAGQLTDDKHMPLRDATVVVFPDDQAKWFESSRSVRAVRPDQEGQWEIKGLPPGEYLGIALPYVEDGGWNDPDYLEALRKDATRVTLAEAASQTVPLKLVVPKQ
jgi:protocatechuate 3,4-dioxygenase beta subunit